MQFPKWPYIFLIRWSLAEHHHLVLYIKKENVLDFKNREWFPVGALRHKVNSIYSFVLPFNIPHTQSPALASGCTHLEGEISLFVYLFIQATFVGLIWHFSNICILPVQSLLISILAGLRKAKWTSKASFSRWFWGTYLSHPGLGESSITRAKGLVDREKKGSHIGICRMTLHPVNTTYCPHLKRNQNELQLQSHLGSPGEHQR